MHVNALILLLVCSIDLDRSLKQVIFGEKKIKIYAKQLLFSKFSTWFWDIVAKGRKKNTEEKCKIKCADFNSLKFIVINLPVLASNFCHYPITVPRKFKFPFDNYFFWINLSFCCSLLVEKDLNLILGCWQWCSDWWCCRGKEARGTRPWASQTSGSGVGRSWHKHFCEKESQGRGGDANRP